MDTLFLPREPGSIETGPQTFLRIDAPNSVFIFTSDPALQDGPGLLNSVQVINGGWNNLNGVFNYTTEFEGKPYYNKDGNSNLFIVWFNNQWQIYDFGENSIDPIYFSNQDTLYPWQVTVWQQLPGYAPLPTVLKQL
jgi:Zn-dependent M28 family amino/carboxypeptidase